MVIWRADTGETGWCHRSVTISGDCSLQSARCSLPSSLMSLDSPITLDDVSVTQSRVPRLTFRTAPLYSLPRQHTAGHLQSSGPQPCLSLPPLLQPDHNPPHPARYTGCSCPLSPLTERLLTSVHHRIADTAVTPSRHHRELVHVVVCLGGLWRRHLPPEIRQKNAISHDRSRRDRRPVRQHRILCQRSNRFNSQVKCDLL